jgi:hypothetical protein
MWITQRANLMELWNHHHTQHSNLKVFKYIFIFIFFPLPCYISFNSLFTILSTMSSLIFFFQLGLSLNSYCFNLFCNISRVRIWVARSWNNVASQPTMHVIGIQIIRQGFLVIRQSFHRYFFLFSYFFQAINVVLQPLH